MLNRVRSLLAQDVEKWCGNIFQSIVIFFCVRVTFFLELYLRLAIPAEKILIILSGFFYYDLLLIVSIAVITCIPYWILQHFASKFNQILIQILLLLYALLYAASAEYFCYTYRPLDQVIYAYTFQELVTTVTASTEISFLSFFPFAANIIIWFLSFYYKEKLIPSQKIAISVFCLCLLSFTIFRYKQIIRSEKGYVKSNDFFMAVNQPSYSYIKITDYNPKDQSLSSLNIEKAKIWWWAQNKRRNFEDTNFPFEHSNNYNDVLGEFFHKTNDGQKPNLVFIIIESLGRKLTVDNPQYSFTPFIDSLASQSLFWPNCISTTERTFGVLPAVFASVPQGSHGFANRREPMPHHTSLLKEAASNGYATSFFYGGCASFSGQDNFLRENNVTNIMQVELDKNDENFAARKQNHSWGLDDQEMIKQAIQQKNSISPFLDVYLTLSTHEPFQFKGIEQYEKKVLDMCTKDQGEEASIIRENKNIYATFLYADDAIRQLLTYYKSRKDYANTIFIITGDHRMGPVNNGQNVMRKYNVPLIIYSPLLKTSRQMNGVVSHYDIAPSISAYLSNNYNYTFPAYTHFLGQEFDTSESFHCNRLQAFMRNNREVSEWIHDTLFLCKNELYTIQPNLELRLIENEKLKTQMLQELEMYQSLSIYSVTNNYLLKNCNRKWIKIYDLNIFPNEKKYESIHEDNLIWKHINRNDDFVHLIKPFTVQGTNLRCEISFKIKNLDTTKQLPYIVFQDFTIPIKSISGKDINTSKTETFYKNIEIPFEKGKQFNLYLRTKNECDFLISNIDIHVFLEE